MALLDGETSPAVFVVRDGKAARVPVTLGYLDGEWAEVREGLKLGDQVVVAGKTAVRDGSVVQVLGDPQAAAQLAAGKPAKATSDSQQ